MKIAGRTFIISGGASGLGRAVVEDLHSNGASIAVLDMNEDLGSSLVSTIGTQRVKFFTTDVTNTNNVKRSVDSATNWMKETGVALGGVICCAGIGYPSLMIDRKGEPLSLDNFKFVVDVNLIGTIDLVRSCLPHLTTVEPKGLDGDRGVVIMVSSAAAFEGQSGQVAYAASKGAVVSMTLPMARDLSRYGIRVMTLAPSMFDSAMTEKLSDKVRQSLLKSMEYPKRPGQPSEFAEVVRTCITSSMLNGEVIRLDGASRMPARL